MRVFASAGKAVKTQRKKHMGSGPLHVLECSQAAIFVVVQHALVRTCELHLAALVHR